jgi:hypothetical protein
MGNDELTNNSFLQIAIHAKLIDKHLFSMLITEPEQIHQVTIVYLG